MKKNVLITGASRGIGRAIAFSFAALGYDLYLTCKSNISLLEKLKKELEDTYRISCKVYQCDCGDYSQVRQLFTMLPPLTVLINNAGISYIGLLTDMEPEDWQQVINTNLSSLFYTCKFAVPSMVSGKQGRIINISSVWGEHGSSMEVAYSASKGGVNAFTKALAKELGPSNITVNAISCGLIDTDMNQDFTREELDSIISDIPCDRMGSTKEVAELCLMLADSPSYLTGQIITIDGGWC